MYLMSCTILITLQPWYRMRSDHVPHELYNLNYITTVVQNEVKRFIDKQEQKLYIIYCRVVSYKVFSRVPPLFFSLSYYA